MAWPGFSKIMVIRKPVGVHFMTEAFTWQMCVLWFHLARTNMFNSNQAATSRGMNLLDVIAR
jgi:hypothetical protein